MPVDQLVIYHGNRTRVHRSMSVTSAYFTILKAAIRDSLARSRIDSYSFVAQSSFLLLRAHANIDDRVDQFRNYSQNHYRNTPNGTNICPVLRHIKVAPGEDTIGCNAPKNAGKPNQSPHVRNSRDRKGWAFTRSPGNGLSSPGV